MPLCFQVDECKQQMLARIADQKADCEMVSNASISKLAGVLFLPRGTCLCASLRFGPNHIVVADYEELF